jgi:hypothetical protein
MKFLFLLLLNLALASSNLSLNDYNISIHKVVQNESFENGVDVPKLTICDIKKDNFDILQRCIHISGNKLFAGQCPRVKFTGNSSRCQFNISYIQMKGN